MGQGPSGMGGPPGGDQKKKDDEKKKKFEPKPPMRTGRKKRKKGPSAAVKTPTVYPTSRCMLRLRKLERIKDFLLMEQEYIQNQEVLKPREEKEQEERGKVEDLRGSPLSVGSLEEMIDDNHAIVSSSVGPEYYVNILSFVNQDLLEPGCSVLLHNKVMSVVGILSDDADPMVSVMKVDKAPLESYADIGGLEAQIQEIKEAVELPLTHPELYEDIGIKPPKGVILYGEPGTGKTLLARAVAHHTDCTFVRVSGAELVQKYIGEGSRMVRELFVMAREAAPSIIFMDEIDSIGATRMEGGSQGGDSEVQRTMLELLNQLDGFEPAQNIKVIMCTNRIDILDPALLRPGRIDRKIEFPNPTLGSRQDILGIHSRKMNLLRGIDLKSIAEKMPNASGAECKAVCTEAGMFALRERRIHVTQEDFEMAVAKVMKKDSDMNMSIKKLWK
mmetsp:Transcript_17916/g.28000  ORF Transcript_17916/g.28000 Transcript_17916/m.28000 type:complete len:445 (-) Transcript_17916:228-1562(-)